MLDYLFPNAYVGKTHKYFISVTGLDAKSKTFNTRKEAEIYMHYLCDKFNVSGIECVEYDKHERKYSNHCGVRFYINRV